ncbi:hypothetical protein E8E13_001073 [Curvularia kusanoi]|uniref:Mannosyl-3-phosphoglycerate synthase n=1 Tax=Curvularia kusanoi TaxID=90978 RepID=A0A9P4W549_CURKU|nr:hypothetical protein E8E13_001073 [Curvularia kusanoi]
MQLTISPRTASIGSVNISALARVTALDCGLLTGLPDARTLHNGSSDVAYSTSSLQNVESRLAIVVPCMNESASILAGVLHGIPQHCLIVLVSNSNAENFATETRLLSSFCQTARRAGLAVHQADPHLARAFVEAGLQQITANDDTGVPRIRNGKGEAMMLGTALTHLANKEFVGFIDADNMTPGAVHEYCRVFAAGLLTALSLPSPSSSPPESGAAGEEGPPLAMVRIKWASKPKIADDKLVMTSEGRCSRVVNSWMNKLFSSLNKEFSQNECDLIQTANAGEHAMSTKLALRLNFATGYAVEPFQFIDAWQRSGLLVPTPPDSPANLIFQDTQCEEATEPLVVAPAVDSLSSFFLPPTPPSSPPDSIFHLNQPEAHSLPAVVAPATAALGRVNVMQVQTVNPHIHDFGKGDTHIKRMQAAGLSTILHSRLTPHALRQELKKYMIEELGDGAEQTEVNVYPAMEGMDWRAFEKVVGDLGHARE